LTFKDVLFSVYINIGINCGLFGWNSG